VFPKPPSCWNKGDLLLRKGECREGRERDGGKAREGRERE